MRAMLSYMVQFSYMFQPLQQWSPPQSRSTHEFRAILSYMDQHSYMIQSLQVATVI